MPAIYRDLQSKCIDIIQFAFMCVICTRVQINLHHLEGRSKFAPGCEFAPGCKFLKHSSNGQKYTPGANLHPRCKFAPGCQGANLHPGAKCAHERSLRCTANLKKPNPCEPSFLSVKVGIKGVYVAWLCRPNVFCCITR